MYFSDQHQNDDTVIKYSKSLKKPNIWVRKDEPFRKLHLTRRVISGFTIYIHGLASDPFS